MNKDYNKTKHDAFEALIKSIKPGWSLRADDYDNPNWISAIAPNGYEYKICVTANSASAVVSEVWNRIAYK